MKSIYSKLILGFLITILLSFPIAGIVAFNMNGTEVDLQVSGELEKEFSFLETTIGSVESTGKLYEILNDYSNSLDSAITLYYNNQNYYYGTPHQRVSLNEITNLFNTEVNIDTATNSEVIYGKKVNVLGNDAYLLIQKDTLERKQSYLNSMLIVFSGIFLMGTIVFFVVADVIVRPITKLIKATKDVSNGNYGVRVSYTGDDEISKLNKSFNQMAVQLGKQEVYRQKFISDVSHEFQTPLTSIQGFAKIIKDETDLPRNQLERYVDIIIYNSNRLSQLSKNMLQLTMLESEQAQLELEEYNLLEQLTMAANSMESNALKKDIEIKFDFPKKAVLIYGDRSKLEQVWTNLISNAIKYTLDHGLITISVKRNQKSIDVSIEDTGLGMSKEVISHIFERFYREDKSRNIEGNGLGLSIVRTIVDLHGGKIDVQSTVDVGSVFTVSLPAYTQRALERLNIKR